MLVMLVVVGAMLLGELVVNLCCFVLHYSKLKNLSKKRNQVEFHYMSFIYSYELIQHGTWKIT